MSSGSSALSVAWAPKRAFYHKAIIRALPLQFFKVGCRSCMSPAPKLLRLDKTRIFKAS
jgi:hypothetical protein